MPLTDLTFLHSRCLPRCDARVDKRFDGYYTLQFMASGGVEVGYDTRRHLLDDGGAWFWTAYPGPHIRFHAAPGHSFWEHRYVAFQGPRVTRWIADGLWPEKPQPAPSPEGGEGDYAARFDDLLALARRGDAWSVPRAVNRLEAFLLELAEDRARSSNGGIAAEPWLSAVLTGIAAEEDPDTPALDYEQMARQAGMALSTLRRRFKQATGVALHEYALQTRIARARSLLGETDLPIKAIAERMGYRDVYFFTRQFRQSVGVPPAAYRRSRQG